MGQKIHIVFASDANYLPGLEVAKRTMIEACSDPTRLEFHIFDEEALTGCAVQNMPKWNGSHMPYLRLWLPSLLPDVDYVVYSDVDTIWNRDVCELWDAAIGGDNADCALYWVRDMLSIRKESGEWIERVATAEGFDFDWTRYGCSGICVMNLEKLRAMGFTERVLTLYARYGIPKFPDQDVLNVVFNHDSALLPSVWGTMGDWRQLPRVKEPCVYHLTGAGRHFHDQVPTVYPPQYQFWWNVRRGVHEVHPRTQWLARLWPLRWAAWMLPLGLRERVVRQLFFASVVMTHGKMV